MLIRGYETQRTDSFAYLVESMHTVMEHALADEGEALVAYALEQVGALKSQHVEADRLILAKSCKGKVRKDGTVDFASAYANPDSMAQVRAAKQRIELGLPFTSGMKVSSWSPMRVSAPCRWPRGLKSRTKVAFKDTTGASTQSAWPPHSAASRRPLAGRPKT